MDREYRHRCFAGASDYIFEQVIDGKIRIEDEQELMLYVEFLGDLHSGLSPQNKEKIVQFLFQAEQNILKLKLHEKCNRLPTEIQEQYLKNGISVYLTKLSEKKQSPSIALLLFLQNLSAISPADLSKILEKTKILPHLSPGDLYFIYPIALSEGSVKKELVARMPIKKWFSLSYSHFDRPITTCIGYYFPHNLLQREDFIKLCSSIRFLSISLLFKITLYLLYNSLYYNSQKTIIMIEIRALALARARALDRVLDRDLDQILDHVLARDLDRVRILDWVLDQVLDRILDRNWRLELDLARDLVRALGLDSALDLLLPPSNPLGKVNLLFSGNDKVSPNLINLDKEPLQLHPFIVIYNKLSLLLLGQGNETDWMDIIEQTKKIQSTKWAKKHIPFLDRKEVKEAIKLLYLGTGKDAIFQAEWFKKNHPYSEALHAKPSEFRRLVDRFIAKYGDEDF
jgi:hypothetical protein